MYRIREYRLIYIYVRIFCTCDTCYSSRVDLPVEFLKSSNARQEKNLASKRFSERHATMEKTQKIT